MHDCIKIKIQPHDIALLNWIMEGYEHLGVVSTLDRREGLLLIRSTPDFLSDVRKIVDTIGFPVEILADHDQL